MLHHLSILPIGLVFSTAASRARRTALGAKRPARLPFPCRYHTAPVHHQRRPPCTFYHRPLQPLRQQADPFLAGTKRPRRHRQRPPLRPFYTNHYSRCPDRPTLSLLLLNGPDATVSAHYFGPSTPTAVSTAMSGLYFPLRHQKSPASPPPTTTLSPYTDHTSHRADMYAASTRTSSRRHGHCSRLHPRTLMG